MGTDVNSEYQEHPHYFANRISKAASAKMKCFHGTIKLLLFSAILVAMTLQEASASLYYNDMPTNECAPLGDFLTSDPGAHRCAEIPPCPEGQKCGYVFWVVKGVGILYQLTAFHSEQKLRT